ncbi:MAG: homoserine kinase [bacterium]|nr:homoserine kinase [bacterium]
MSGRRENARPLSTATAVAPATVANVAVGFDLLGHSVSGPGDRVTARRSQVPGVRIVEIRGTVTDLPRDPARNTAGHAVERLLAAEDPQLGVDLEIDKGIPLSSGLGGSAASAVAALVATNALLDSPLHSHQLYPFALAGEAVASGAAHGDNVGPALFGGLVMATADDVRQLPVPAGLHAAVVHPELELETRRAREVLRPPYELSALVTQQSHLAAVFAALYENDLELLAENLRDTLVEPRRAELIPGFAAVKAAALAAGALGASISGGGPSVFAWFRDAATAGRGGETMQRAFADHGVASQPLVSPVAGPAARVEHTA